MYVWSNFKAEILLLNTISIKNLVWTVHGCKESPCNNGGSCIEDYPDVSCECKSEYIGRLCQKGSLFILNT